MGWIRAEHHPHRAAGKGRPDIHGKLYLPGEVELTGFAWQKQERDGDGRAAQPRARGAGSSSSAARGRLRRLVISAKGFVSNTKIRQCVGLRPRRPGSTRWLPRVLCCDPTELPRLRHLLTDTTHLQPSPLLLRCRKGQRFQVTWSKLTIFTRQSSTNQLSVAPEENWISFEPALMATKSWMNLHRAQM